MKLIMEDKDMLNEVKETTDPKTPTEEVRETESLEAEEPTIEKAPIPWKFIIFFGILAVAIITVIILLFAFGGPIPKK